MLSLTQTTGYAIKALTALAEAPGACAQSADIARWAGVPRPYLAKIIQSLARAGIVVSKRGIGGGVSLARASDQISLLQIVEATEGTTWLGSCLLGLDECSDHASCPTHDFWRRVSGEICDQLRNTSLAAVVAARTPARPTRAARRPACSPGPNRWRTSK